MLSFITHAAVLALAVQASTAAMVKRQTTSTTTTTTGVVPLGSSTDVFNEGSACKASWTPDTSGATTWKSMTIDLMTGANLDMKKLATVVSGIDGTNSSLTSYEYQCPEVTPNSAIYFLQYTYGSEEGPTWTTRFAIASASGQTTTPPHANQPAGGSPAIPWGNGKLTGSSASLTVLTPESGSSSSSTSSSSTTTTTGSSTGNNNAAASGSSSSSPSTSSTTSSDSTQTTSADSSNATTSSQQESSSNDSSSSGSSSSSKSSGAATVLATSAGVPIAIAAVLAVSFL